jgi:hypothetical protein
MCARLRTSFAGETKKASVTNLNSTKRPFQITILGWLFIVVGILSTTYHLLKGSLDRWMVLIVLVGIIAIVAGVFLLRGARWARWLLLAWLAFHVVVSALNSLPDAMPHVVLLLVVGYFLLGPPTSKYFQRAQPE